MERRRPGHRRELAGRCRRSRGGRQRMGRLGQRRCRSGGVGFRSDLTRHRRRGCRHRVDGPLDRGRLRGLRKRQPVRRKLGLQRLVPEGSVAATCGLDFERRLSASSFDVRRSIAEALRDLGFEITVDQLTRMEAKRGSLLGSSLMLKKQMPVLAVFEISAEASGYVVLVHLTDNMPNLIGKTWGVNHQYREILAEVQRRVDLGLAKLDGAASLAFAEATFWSRAADHGLVEQSNVLTAKAVDGAVDVASKALDGGSSATPRVWKGVDSVTFTSGAGVTVLTLAETQAALGVAVMIVSHPGSMPANLARDVETFAAVVERRLTAAAGKAAAVEVSDAQRPALE